MTKATKTITVSALAARTGHDRRTIERRLHGEKPVRTETVAGKRVRHYAAARALTLVREANTEAADRASLGEVVASIAETRAAARAGKLLRKSVVVEEINARAAELDAFLRGFPGRVNPKLTEIDRLDVSEDVKRERMAETIRADLAFAKAILRKPYSWAR